MEWLAFMNSLSNQCRRKAEADGLVSVMNNTKWRELCFAFSSFDVKPAWRTRRPSKRLRFQLGS